MSVSRKKTKIVLCWQRPVIFAEQQTKKKKKSANLIKNAFIHDQINENSFMAWYFLNLNLYTFVMIYNLIFVIVFRFF